MADNLGIEEVTDKVAKVLAARWPEDETREVAKKVAESLVQTEGGGPRFSISKSELLGLLIRLSLVGLATYYGVKWIVYAMDPTRKQKQEAKMQAREMKIFFYYLKPMDSFGIWRK